MKGRTYATAILSLALLAVPAYARDTDAQIRRKIIQQSIDRYPGSCPCPHNTMRNGARCGARSAYSRPGGYAPKCYPKDVTAADIAEYRMAYGA